MSLQSLCRLAEEQLIEDPDFERKPVAWNIVVDSDGGLLGISSRRQDLNEGTKRKPKWVGVPMLVPIQRIRTVGDLPFFFVDKSEYALGFDPDGKRPQEKLDIRSDLFAQQIEACASETNDEAAIAVARFMRKLPKHRASIELAFASAPWKPNDLFAFRFGIETRPVHLRESIQAYWKRCRGASDGEEEVGAFVCLVTGKRMSSPGLFPQLKGIPGAVSSGASLVSFNIRSLESFNLHGNENAPISRTAAETAGTALRRLLSDAYPNPRAPDEVLPSRHERLGQESLVAFWSSPVNERTNLIVNGIKGSLDGDTSDKVEEGEKDTPADVREVYRSLWQGRPVSIKEPGRFHALVMSGAQGRVVVRDWIETTLADAVENLAQHFDNLKIVQRAHMKSGLPREALPIRMLLDSIVVSGRDQKAVAGIERGVLRSAFLGTPYPLQIIQRAILRARAEVSGEAGDNKWIAIARADARAGLLKAVLNRRRRMDSQSAQRYPEVPIDMNPQLESTGYTLGMLMAVLERLQQAALGSVNASVVDRFFGAASATPRSVFVRLLKNARHHARKAQDSDEGTTKALAFRLDRLIDQLIAQFSVEKQKGQLRADGIPAHLDLEQQGLFILGYHQMKHWLWMKADERRESGKEPRRHPGSILLVKARTGGIGNDGITPKKGDQYVCYD